MDFYILNNSEMFRYNFEKKMVEIVLHSLDEKVAICLLSFIVCMPNNKQKSAKHQLIETIRIAHTLFLDWADL